MNYTMLVIWGFSVFQAWRCVHALCSEFYAADRRGLSFVALATFVAAFALTMEFVPLPDWAEPIGFATVLAMTSVHVILGVMALVMRFCATDIEPEEDTKNTNK